MPAIKKILVPVDLSSASIGAAHYAVALSAAQDAEIVFLHALEGGWPLSGAKRGNQSRIQRAARQAPARFLVREGLPAAVIVEAANSENADLILMPTSGPPALLRLAGFSVTAAVMRDARCPVWTAQSDLESHAAKPIKQILCGLTGAAQSAVVLRFAAALSQKLQAGLSFIHAERALSHAIDIPCDPEYRLFVRGLVNEELAGVRAAAGVAGEIQVEAGETLAVVPAAAERIDADLLVVGRSDSDTILGRWRMTGFELIRRASCPMVCV
jgi:nucleotide-binding universal stress UspA family protein